MKINIGAGYNNPDGFVTVDHDPACNPDYCVDIEKQALPFDDNTVTAVVAHHILEHLGEGYFHVLQELYRVCAPGAIIDIRVPHPRHESFLADPTHRRAITPLGLQLFSKTFNAHCRSSGLPASQLGIYYDVDFDLVEWHYIPVEDYKQKFTSWSASDIEEYISEHNNIVSEYHIRLMVNKTAT